MNLRQKAKRFKKLYEEGLPKRPYPVVYNSLLPIHYKIECFIDKREVDELQDCQGLLKTVIENRILDNIKPLIWDNLKTKKDVYRYGYRYRLDIWLDNDSKPIYFDTDSVKFKEMEKIHDKNNFSNKGH